MILPVEHGEEWERTVSDAMVRTKEFFSEDTPLKRAEEAGGRPYERRIQQEQMAFAVAEAMERGRNLCVEAPTGVGKSFAYLVPAIYHSLSMHKSVLITTETIHLQEQLVNRDLPFLRKLLGLDFTFVIAKGRANYLCKRRLDLLRGTGGGDFLPMQTAAPELERLADWARETEDGSRSAIPFRVDPQLWPCVCSEASTCRGQKCSYFHTCFYWKARKLWDKADLVVTNHALFFTDLKIREIEHEESCPLPPYCAVVFDEAHTMEDNAAEHLGLHVNSYSVRYLLNRLFNPTNGRGLLSRPGTASMALRGMIGRVHESAESFFAQFEESLSKQADECLRIQRPGLYQDPLSPHFSELESMLKEYLGDDEEENNDRKTELSAQLERCTACRNEIEQFIAMSLPEQVYWAESRGGSPRQGTSMGNVELSSAPLNVAEILNRILFSKEIPVILTSATLAVRGTLDYFVRRIGFSGGDGMILDSPFDYRKQVKLYLTRTMPLPSERNFNDAASDNIRDFVMRTRGRAFVLFTSYGMLKYCAERLYRFFLASGIRLLIQGDSLSRSAMLDEFKKGNHSVIFGATSFWTGVDVPGEALSNVIITKLPFSVPSHPLIAARCERIQQEGGNPFRDYSIPDAVLKFRQGIGRLIRSKTDTGIIVVLDPRVLSKQYGRQFLESIPSCPVEYF